jgi:hypothetical protein
MDRAAFTVREVVLWYRRTLMIEEKVEEHEHVISEAEDGRSESHSEKIVEKGTGDRPSVTVEKETVIRERD